MSIADAGLGVSEAFGAHARANHPQDRKKGRTLAKELRDETRIKSYLNAAQGLGKHRRTCFAGKNLDFSGKGSNGQRRQRRKSRLSGAWAGKCGAGLESEFDVTVFGCQLWQRTELEQRNAEVETEEALLVTEGRVGG